MKKRKLAFFAIVVAFAVLLSSYQLDSYITRPGGAYDLGPLVEVVGGDEDDEGTLSLMTISLMKATPVLYAYAKFQDGYKVMSADQIRSPHESDQEYNVRQLKMMADSQVNALQVAFDIADKPYEVNNNGVYVMTVLEGGAADGILEPGDRVISVDDNKFDTQEEFIDYLSDQEKGQQVELVYVREGREITDKVKLAALPTNPERIGIGIAFVENKEIETDPKVTIDSEEIGGPSAGLMFTLEILNRLLDEDITKGYNIAGTGTMESDGTVGRIGGIDQKVIAADNQDIEIFFAPDDETEGAKLSNYELAKKTAEKIGTDMKVVPVKNIEEAMKYLEDLQPK